MSPGRPEESSQPPACTLHKKNQGSKKFEILVYSGVDQAVRGKGAEHSDDPRAPAGAARNAGSYRASQHIFLASFVQGLRARSMPSWRSTSSDPESSALSASYRASIA